MLCVRQREEKDANMQEKIEKCVVECFFQYESQYEDSGTYRMVRDIQLLGKGAKILVDAMSDADITEKELEEWFLDFWEGDVLNLKTVAQAMQQVGMYELDQMDIVQVVTPDQISSSRGERLLLEVKIAQGEGVRGYISFCKISQEEYDRFERQSVAFEKLVRV